MINILYEQFPRSIRADGAEYEIVTDFRDWIQFADLIADDALPKEIKIGFMGQWLIEPPKYMTADIADALSRFYAADELEYIRESSIETDAESDEIRRPPVFDWRIDARYVLGDFRRFYNIDLLGVGYMHWWEFRSLFAALPDDSSCHKRMIYRGTNLAEIKNDQERKRIRRIQQQIAIPFELNDGDIGDIFGGMM